MIGRVLVINLTRTRFSHFDFLLACVVLPRYLYLWAVM
jgi:hypothetical protein